MLPAAASGRRGGGGGPSLRPRPRSRSRRSRSSRESPSPSAPRSRPPHSRSRGRRSSSGSSDQRGPGHRDRHCRSHSRSSGSRDRDRRRHHCGASQASSGTRGGGGVPARETRPGDSRSRPHPPPPPRLASTAEPVPSASPATVLAPTLLAEGSEDSSSEASSSPAAQVLTYEPLFPSEDVQGFAFQMRRMADTLHLQVQLTEEHVEDPVFNLIEESAPPVPALPVLPTLARVVQRSWESPASVPPTSEQLDSLYRMADAEEEWYSHHPTPNSVAVNVAQLQRPTYPRSTPSNKEGKKLDLIGQKIYSTASLLFKIANYSACMAGYQLLLQQKLMPLFDSLPENEKRLAHLFSQEALELAGHQASAARHVANCSGKAASTAVFLRRHAWLRSSTLNPYARALVEGLPFDLQGLFHADTDQKLDHLQKMPVVARKLSLGSHPASGRPSGGSRAATQHGGESPRFQAAQSS